MTTDPLVLKYRTAIQAWLFACLLLVAFMVAVGGYTRLSGSGLSITEWKPVHGIIPPMNPQEWMEELAAYHKSPQGRQVNIGLDVEAFKKIYWPEYWHRVLGRMIGLVFIVPLLFFALSKSITRRFGWQLATIFALGGLQGLAGWLMVQSGLVDDPTVSHIRLAIHLSLAFAIFGLIWWSLLRVNSSEWRVKGDYGIAPSTLHASRLTYHVWFTLLCLQIILGAFVAGLKAGLIYNTWPTMNGVWIATEVFSDPKPWYENVALVQFLHRWVAAGLVIFFTLWWHHWRKSVKELQLLPVCTTIAGFMLLQFILGVMTLLYAVPMNLALAHQMGGLALFAAGLTLLYSMHRIRRNT
ncbi:MAG: COX15/CtaA family protein [Alphaproteobacteria bacterium]